MSFINDIKARIKELTTGKQEVEVVVKTPEPMAYFRGYEMGQSFSLSYDGQKNLGELGPARDYYMDYPTLRTRSYQAYVENEIAKTVLGKYATWVVGKGLKLQAEPNQTVLKAEKINLKKEDFNEIVEARFKVFAENRGASHSGMESLQTLAKAALLNMIIGGDALVIIRVVGETAKTMRVTIELKDGGHVRTPWGGGYLSAATVKGHKICDGVEVDKSGRHVAYYVCQPGGLDFTRVEARNSTGSIMAFLVYGEKYKPESLRGMPLIATMLETLKKLDRYKEATVGSAEEAAKIAYQIIHHIAGSGESPFLSNAARAFDAAAPANTPKDVSGVELANTVAATTNKQAYNMPQGAELKTIDRKADLYFKDFYGVNFDLFCSAVQIPPEVARSMYNSNYSASRAAIKDWEHTLLERREEFAFRFYKLIYHVWLDVEVLKNKVQAPGYLKAMAEQDTTILDAYRQCRFTGPNVPQIDPVKEVKAERMKLGPLADNQPLTTIEAATEALNSGDSDSNMAQFAEELKYGDELGLKQEVPVPVVTGGGD